MLLQGRLHGQESLSRELFATALKLAANLDLTGPEASGPDTAGPAAEHPAAPGETLAQRRQAFAARLRDLVARVITIDEIDAASRRETVGVQP
jgi:glycerol-3-phosphate O-acyltransferase